MKSHQHGFSKVEKIDIDLDSITVVDYHPRYQPVFRALNLAWISNFFEVEEKDTQMLDYPEKQIIEPGGKILIALYNEEPVGVGALVRMTNSEYDFELAKMAISSELQGKGIGWVLGQALVQAARELGGRKIYLESNTKLKPALKLYRKLGFREIPVISSPYRRVDIQMELIL